MYHLGSFHLRDMTACGAALRRLGTGAASLEAAADRLVRYLYDSLTIPQTKESACVLVRLFKTTPYGRLPPELRDLAVTELKKIPDDPSFSCLTLLASAGAVRDWNDPSRSSRYRVIPLGSPDDLARLPMFSQLFHQLGISLPQLTQPGHNLLLDSQEHLFNVFHVLQAEGSPYIPAQDEFVLRYGVRSVLGFGAPLPNGDIFSVILFSKQVIPEATAQLFKPLAICAQIALAPHVQRNPSPGRSEPLSAIKGVHADHPTISQLQDRIAQLEKLLAVHEHTVNLQATRMETIVGGADIGTWEWDIPSGYVTFNHQWASMLGYRLEDLEPHIRTWEILAHPDDKPAVMEALAAHLRGDTAQYSSEHRLRNKNGTWQWVFDSGRVIVRDASGAPIRAAGIHLDISARKTLEEALRKSEERFRQLAEHIEAVFWLTSADKRDILYVSPAFETIWGRSRAAVYADPTLWIECIHPADRDRIAVAAACQSNLPYDEEYRIILPDGTIRWIRDRGFPVKDQAGGVYRLAGIAVDITAAKEMETAIRASETRYRSLVELSPNAVFVNCDGRMVFANQACATLLGAPTADQLIGRQVVDFIHPDSRALAQERMRKMSTTHQVAPSLEERFCRLDGSVIPVEVTAAPILFGGKQAFQVIAIDVSAHKRLEQALLSANLQLTAILDGATNVSIIATNTEGLITTFNTGAEAVLGYASHEMVGEQVLTALHLQEQIDQRARELSELHARSIGGFEALIANARHGGFDEREWTYVRKDGTHLTVLSTITALRNEEGTITGFLALGKDITQRKQAERALTVAARELERKNVELAHARDEALQAVQLKADFLATMSHEIRTPMNAIIGMTGLLLDTSLTPDQHEFADTVRRSSDALLTLVNDILDFSKIEAGKLQFETLSFDLRTTMEDTLELLAEQAQSKGLELIGLVDAAVPIGVLGDPGRLRQILVNLIGNAIKFTSTGEVFLHVTCEAHEGPGLLRFAIRDTGIGIPDAVQARLFQAFTQADSSTTRRYGGTGLGLAICQRLVHQMQGQIGIESRPGQGSTFWFTAHLPEATLPAPPPTHSRTQLHGRRILLVDPNKTVRHALHQQLVTSGIDCVGAQNGHEAYEMARAAAAKQKPFDLALIDLHLPDMDGFEAATGLKSDPVTAVTRVVILTTVGRRGDGSTAQALGIDAYLTKPLRQSQLLDCLCRLVDGTAPVDRGQPIPATPLITRHTLAEAQASAITRLLLAEDNPVNQKVACKMLEKLGCRIDVVGNGQEAITAHERTPYPLIFMDCQMPEMDGFEATAMIRKMEGSSRHTPIVAMTANAMKGDREKCLAAGMDDYVAKPIRPKDLQTILDTWLPKRDQASAA